MVELGRKGIKTGFLAELAGGAHHYCEGGLPLRAFVGD